VEIPPAPTFFKACPEPVTSGISDVPESAASLRATPAPVIVPYDPLASM
jgi:hypothetical protein